VIAAAIHRDQEPPLVSEEEERGPLRRCLATRERLPKDGMVRFVVGPDRTLVPDLEGRLPGRGLWLTARRDIIERAVAKRLIERACEGEVKVPRDLARQVEALSRRRALHLIGLARRAGEAVAGYEKVKSWLAEGRAALLLQAADGAAEQRRKLRATAPGLAPIELFRGVELADALGREIAVHVAVAPGGLALRIAAECRRAEDLAEAEEAKAPSTEVRKTEGL